MPKTIAITPSWYWPAHVPRVVGVPPFAVHELLVERRARREPDGLALVGDDERLTNADLAARVRDWVEHPQPAGGLLIEPPTVAGAVAVLGALARGAPFVLPETAPVPGGESSGTLTKPVLGLDARGTVAWHSQRSLVAGALSLGAFLELGADRPWLSTFPLASWEGIFGLTVPLAAGAPVVLGAAGEPALGAIAREGAGYAFTDLSSAFAATRDAKREVKSARGVLNGLLLSVPGVFDADHRRRVGRLFECPALTVFGIPETGPVFAAHPSWYVDEAVGIPVTNAHVVPVDPRSGVPVATLWELVESAMVTVFSPQLCVGYEDGAYPERFRDGRFVTGVIASSDANGMIYLLPD